jgi:hypothetical protein
MTYTDDLFSAWQGNFLISGLSSQAIIRIEIDGDDASAVLRKALTAYCGCSKMIVTIVRDGC